MTSMMWVTLIQYSVVGRKGVGITGIATAKQKANLQANWLLENGRIVVDISNGDFQCSRVPAVTIVNL